MYYEKKKDKVKFSAIHFLCGPTLHIHNEAELIINVGEGALADVYINSKKYRLNPNEAVLITPNQIHTCVNLSEGLYLLFNFNVDYVPYLSKFLSTKQPESPVFSLDETNTSNILYSYWAIQDKLRFVEPLNFMQSTTVGFLNTFLGVICSKIKFVDSGDDIELFNKIVEYINQHYTEEITLTSIANKLNYYKSTISRIFNSTAGITVPSFINWLRASAAADLLISTDKSITDICFDTGFKTIRNFNRSFLEFYGDTPSRYRKAHK